MAFWGRETEEFFFSFAVLGVERRSFHARQRLHRPAPCPAPRLSCPAADSRGPSWAQRAPATERSVAEESQQLCLLPSLEDPVQQGSTVDDPPLRKPYDTQTAELKALCLLSRPPHTARCVSPSTSCLWSRLGWYGGLWKPDPGQTR